MNDQQDILSRLDRIEEAILKLSEGSVKNDGGNKSVTADISDRPGNLLSDIERYRKGTDDKSFLKYLDEMEKEVLRQQIRMDGLRRNLNENYKKYLSFHQGSAEPAADTKQETATASAIIDTEKTETISEELTIAKAVNAGAGEVITGPNKTSDALTKSAETDATAEATGILETAAATGVTEISETPVAEETGLTSEAEMTSENETGQSEQQIGTLLFEADNSEYTRKWTDPESATASEGTEEGKTNEPVNEKAPERSAPSAEKTADTPVRSLEFHFGSVVLSVVGAVLVILSMILFGKTYMDNLSQGIALYVLGGIVIAFSELVLRKHIETFSKVISGIGLGILYTSTILNYLYLGTIKAPVAIAITIAVSVFALIFSRQKDSGFLRAIGILGCYVSMVPIQKFDKTTDFIVPVVILLIVNALYLALPNKTYKTALSIIHSVANTVMAYYFMIMLYFSPESVREGVSIPVVIFLAGFIIIAAFISRSSKGGAPVYVGFCCQVVISLLALLWISVSDDYIIALLIFAVAYGVCLFLDWDKENLRWIHLYSFAILVLGATIGREENIHLIAVAAVLAVFKLLSGRKELSVAGLIITIYSALVFIDNVSDPSNLQYIILAIMVLAVFYPGYYKSAQQIILMFTLQIYAVTAFDVAAIFVPLGLLFVVLLMVLLLFFENLRGDHFAFVKWTALVCGAVWILISPSIERDGYISMTAVLLLGLVLIFILFGSVYKIGGEGCLKARSLVLAGFFTYMTFVYRIDKPYITSIILMVISIVCVGFGFYIKQKPLRLYGLVLALFVCGKLLLSDFSDSSSSDKVILTFVVGILAIGISYIYMRLEKNGKDAENSQQQISDK